MSTAVARRIPLRLIVPVVLSAAVLTGGALTATAVGPTGQNVAAAAGMSHRALNASRLAFHDQMRKLWEDHVTWTRLAIVTFADGSPGFPATAQRLLSNQADIGAAIAPFFGATAGDHLAALLHDHITLAVAILQAAKDGDSDAFSTAKAKWYANANDIADYLAALNPRFWRDAMMREDMKAHLDETLTEAADELAGHYTAGVQDYEAVHLHILAMADMLSSGIIERFPAKFH
jgi:hypothetical protein